MKVTWRGPDGPLFFDRPEHLISTSDPAGIDDAFEQVESALAAGRYVAGFATYELGSYLVPRQAMPIGSRLPLIAFGVYAAPARLPEPGCKRYRLSPLLPAVSQPRYTTDVKAILAAIREGDVYQVNYSVPFAFELDGDPYALFDALASTARYPYAAYVEDATHALISLSPELFMCLEPGRVTTKPMKGTAKPEQLDELAGAKNQAEHVMIVDLLRNDLYRLGGSVDVERLCQVESYPHFSTMTSTIVGYVSRGIPLRDVFAAMFPSGSVTGAPKVAAMQAIAKTERRPRGIFCGSIGYMAPDGTGCWNVAIRTATIDKQTRRGRLDIGGGIVADSVARDEWAEILTKRRAFAERAPRLELIETLRREPDGSYLRLDLHLERLCSAASDLHVPCDPRRIRRALADIVASDPVIVRIQIAEDGALDVSTRSLEAIAPPVPICWAPANSYSTDPFLQYKTTWRSLHDQALAFARQNGCFDAIVLNERGDVCEGARTTIFVERDGHLATPPLRCGLLPGVLRRSLLDAGVAHEEPLTRLDVAGAARVFVGNSVYGLLAAQLI